MDCDIIIACEDDGTLARGAETLIRDYFAENPLVNMVYGDEDRLDEHGHLTDPWLKPDWSPDTFLSTFYFGSIFAIRASELMLINPGERTAAAFEARASIAADSEEEKEAASAELAVSRVQKADPLGQQSDPRLPDRAFQRRIRFAAARQHYYSQQG